MTLSHAISRRRLLAAAAAGAIAPRAASAQALPDLGGRRILAVTENAFPPLNMVDPKTGKGIGWEYDCFNEIARRLHLAVEWHVSSWDAMIESVRNGQFDVGMDGIGIDDQRRSQVDFSAPYMHSRMLMMVRAAEARFRDPLTFRANPTLLAGAQAGTTGFHATAHELLGVASTSPRIKLFETFGASMQALGAGDVDVVLSDPTGAAATLARSPGRFKIIGPALPGEDYGFILRKGSPFKAPIDAALAAMARDGTMAQLNKRWLPELPGVGG